MPLFPSKPMSGMVKCPGKRKKSPYRIHQAWWNVLKWIWYSNCDTMCLCLLLCMSAHRLKSVLLCLSLYICVPPQIPKPYIHPTDGRSRLSSVVHGGRTYNRKAERYPTPPYMPIEPTNFNQIFDGWTNDGSRMDGRKTDRQTVRQTGWGRWGEGGWGSHFMVVIKWVDFWICSIDSGGF